MLLNQLFNRKTRKKIQHWNFILSLRIIMMYWKNNKIFNVLSVIFFFISSFSLLLLPFSTDNGVITSLGYITAGIFWAGLILGILIQIIANKICQNLKKTDTRFNKIAMISSGIFFCMFIIILIFFKKNIWLLSIDIALMFFCFELYFIRKKEKIS